MNLQSLIEELERQKPLKWDKKTNSSELEMTLVDDKPMFQLPGDQIHSISNSCHVQIAEKLEIPVKYYRKMECEATDLLVKNVNKWLKANSKNIFIRGLED